MIIKGVTETKQEIGWEENKRCKKGKPRGDTV